MGSFYNKYGKRVFDIFLSFIGIIIFSPVFLIIAFLIKIGSRGPVFFNQKRVGKNGKKFVMYKFRTMYKGAEKDKEKYHHLNISGYPTFKIPNDPRFTKFGRFLAHSSLDELPQLFNILKGNMSFVGPRPPTPDEVNEYKKWHFKRLSVIPGLTSPWAVEGMHKMSFEGWVKSDIAYMSNISFLYDISIIIKTMSQVLGKFRILVPIGLYTLIVYFSVIEGIEIVDDFFINEGTIAHFIGYFLLSSAWVFYFSNKKVTKKIVLKSIIITILLGILVEIVQFFIPYRNFEFFDIIVNVFGASLIFPIYILFNRRK